MKLRRTGQAFKEVQKCPERATKGDWRGVFTTVRRWGWVRVPVHGLALRGLDFPVAPKDNASGLSHQLAQRWGRKERKKVGFQVLSGQTTKPEVDSSLLLQVCILS